MTAGLLLDLFPMGVVTLDAEGRLRAANSVARRMLAESQGLDLTSNKIVAVRREDAAALARFFEGTCPHAEADGLHVRGAMHISGGSHRPKLTVLVADMHGRSGAPASEFVLFLHQPDVAVSVCETILRTLHRLTHTEARVAALLVSGHSVARIATEVGSSANTVRTHLKRAFAKLEVASQSALTRAVLSGPAALRLGRGS